VIDSLFFKKIKMTNRTLSIIGIGSYLLSVYATTTNAEGKPGVSDFIILSSSIVNILFSIIATIRLLKTNKIVAVLFGSTSFLLILFEYGKIVLSPVNGSTFILAFNSIMLISFFLYFYALFILWRSPNLN